MYEEKDGPWVVTTTDTSVKLDVRERTHSPDWKSLTFTIPDIFAKPHTVTIETPPGGGLRVTVRRNDLL